MDLGDHVPMHPGRILLERVMRPLGISRNQLARDIDVPVGRISDITNGKRGVTPDTAMRLGRYFGVPAQLWLRLQAEHDLHAVRTTTWSKIEPRVRVLETARALYAAGTPDPLKREPLPAGIAAVDQADAGARSGLPAEALLYPPAKENIDLGESSDPIGIPPLPWPPSS